ncbi:MAG TPA: hypothetical protein VIW23_00810 [Candidatus Acidoferrum sp.]
MKHLTLILAGTMVLASAVPTLAQRAHPSGPPSGPGGPPPGVGSGASGNSGMGGTREGVPPTHTDMSHASPSDVLSHNTAVAGKIQTLTGQDAQAACAGFKNLGQCVAAAHVAKNLDIPGGFDALKAKVTGSGAVSLGKAIEQLSPQANAKAEAKKANKQASDDLKESSS